MSLLDNNTIFNITIATQDFFYTNGGSGFGAVQGGGTMTGVFFTNSNISNSISLNLLNPAFGITVSSVVLTVEFIGGNI